LQKLNKMLFGINKNNNWKIGRLNTHAKNDILLMEMEFERSEAEWKSYKYMSTKVNNDLDDEDLSDCYEDNNYIIAFDVLGRRVNKKDFDIELKQIL
jgi:hypothetical protein